MNGKLCAPAILYVGFSLTQIIIDTFKGFYDVAFFKSIVMIVFTIVLNALCSQGLGIISWLIVFLPFIMMTYITAILMITLGFGNNSTDTKNKVVYPSDYPKVLHMDRQPNISGNKHGNQVFVLKHVLQVHCCTRGTLLPKGEKSVRGELIRITKRMC